MSTRGSTRIVFSLRKKLSQSEKPIDLHCSLQMHAARQTRVMADQSESDVAVAEVELTRHPLFCPFGCQLIGELLWSSLPLLLSATLLQCPRSLTQMRAQSAVVPSGPLDAHALQGDSTLIDPTCHAEAMANFSTACMWNSGDGKLTLFNNSLWKRRLAGDNNVSDTF